LAAERRAAGGKSEYLDGVVVALSGARRAHYLIALNLAASLHDQL
jgi:hypothetical protein